MLPLKPLVESPSLPPPALAAQLLLGLWQQNFTLCFCLHMAIAFYLSPHGILLCVCVCVQISLFL